MCKNCWFGTSRSFKVSISRKTLQKLLWVLQTFWYLLHIHRNGAKVTQIMFYHLKESRTLGVWIWYVHWANKKVDMYVGLQQNIFYPISAVQNYSTPDTSTIPNKSWVKRRKKGSRLLTAKKLARVFNLQKWNGFIRFNFKSLGSLIDLSNKRK